MAVAVGGGGAVGGAVVGVAVGGVVAVAVGAGVRVGRGVAVGSGVGVSVGASVGEGVAVGAVVEVASMVAVGNAGASTTVWLSAVGPASGDAVRQPVTNSVRASKRTSRGEYRAGFIVLAPVSETMGLDESDSITMGKKWNADDADAIRVISVPFFPS